MNLLGGFTKMKFIFVVLVLAIITFFLALLLGFIYFNVESRAHAEDGKLYMSPIYNEASISTLLSNGDKFDGERVAVHAVTGTSSVTNSRLGTSIFIYYLHPSLEDKDLRMVKVLSYSPLGHTSIGTKIIVLGVFHVSARFGGVPFTNWIEPVYLQAE
jgi:hypothetical protein